MKKVVSLGLSLLLLSVNAGPLAYANTPENPNPQDAVSLLSDYFSGSLTNLPPEALEDEEKEDLPTEQEILAVLAEDQCTVAEPIQDINDYIEELGDFEQSGKLNEWEKKRSELYRYIQKSNWHTRKNISDADRAFVKTLETIFVGLIREGLSWCGADSFFDRIDNKRIHDLESNEEVQYAKQAIIKDITESLSGEHHAINELYVRIQNNAFEVVLLNYVDYNKLATAFPEVRFLFEDLYTFFKWRYELRLDDPSYKLNENNIDSEFRASSHTNSFFAWWELSNLAKANMRDAVEGNHEGFSNADPQEERDNMELYNVFAKRSHYFGRLWNGVQKYAVVRAKALPKERKPKRGAQKPKIIRTIRQSMKTMSKDQIATALEDIRHNYIDARIRGEKAWNTWKEKYIETKEKEFETEVQEALQEILEQEI